MRSGGDIWLSGSLRRIVALPRAEPDPNAIVGRGGDVCARVARVAAASATITGLTHDEARRFQVAYDHVTEPDPRNVSNLADMVPGIIGGAPDKIPRDVLEGLAADLIRSYGDDTTDAFALIDSWLGGYVG